MSEIVSKNLDTMENPRTFLDGSMRSVVDLPSLRIGRGIYNPGWKWSEHVKPQIGKDSEPHIGYLVSGKFIIKAADGKETEVGPGEAFEIGAGHDAWVIGDEPVIALDFTCR